MFDYETKSLWTAISGESLEGIMEGKRLEEVASSQKITWGEWHRLHPDTKILSYHSKETAGYDNYRDYHNSWLKTGIFPPENRDPRLKPKTTVIGLDINGRQKAYPLDLFKNTMIISDDFQGMPLLLYHDSLTNDTIVYSRRIEDVILEFGGLKPSAFQQDKDTATTDNSTKTIWDLKTGKAINGPLKGKVMERVNFKKAYWFIWSDFFWDSEVYS